VNYLRRCFTTLFISTIIMGLLCGCNPKIEEKHNGFWKEEDFSFYDESGKESMFPTTEDYWIHMEDGAGLLTYRGIEIGDRATNIIQLYDLTDFEWSIADFSKLNPNAEDSENYESQLINQGKTVKDILNMLPEISSKGLDVYIWCDVYEVNGALCTESEIGTITESDIRKHFSFDESIDIPDRYYEYYKMDLLKYSISFSIEAEKVSDVGIESSYHNRLHG